MKNYFEVIADVQKIISSDSMGGSPFEKCALICYIAEVLNYKNYLEIGVYKGRSLFSIAAGLKQIHQTGVLATGIDPYTADCFVEEEGDPEIIEAVQYFAKNNNFEELFSEVLQNRKLCQLENEVTIVRESSLVASEKIQSDKYEILHIDGNHDSEVVSKDAALYIPKIKRNGVIIFDDIDFPGPKKIYEHYKNEYVEIFNNGSFGVLIKAKDNSRTRILQRKTKVVYERIKKTLLPSSKPKVLALVLTFNAEKYIEECLNSLASQRINFPLKIYVKDDKSEDDTASLLSSFENNNPLIDFEYSVNPARLGYVKNYIEALAYFRNSDFDFLFLLEGDDYLSNCSLINDGIQLMASRPEVNSVFPRMILKEEKYGTYSFNPAQASLKQGLVSLEEMENEYKVGTWSGTLIRRDAILELTNEFIEETSFSDWMSFLYFYHFGEAYFNSKPGVVYRHQVHGAWSSLAESEKTWKLYGIIQRFNDYTRGLHRASLDKFTPWMYFTSKSPEMRKRSLLIIDDVFPNKASLFRKKEYESYLEEFQDCLILSDGLSNACLTQEPFSKVCEEFYLSSNFSSHSFLNVFGYDFKHFQLPEKFQLCYVTFLSNAARWIDFIEKNKLDFVLQLYPGEGFRLHDAESDKNLKRVISSPYFKKVIVTQLVTRDYLLYNEFCSEDKVEFIPGVVTSYIGKEGCSTSEKVPNYNEPLSVCFCAFRYTANGEDKGYDFFVELARKLTSLSTNFRFTVIGNFDAHTIELGELAEYFTFEGVLHEGDFSCTLARQDILISYNRPNKIASGAFDGFPNGASIEASLQGVLVLANDPYKNSKGIFGEENVIKPIVDLEQTTQLIRWYDLNRANLFNDSLEQSLKVKEVFSYDSQCRPRIKILRELIEAKQRNIKSTL